jgi:hypothetical protein
MIGCAWEQQYANITAHGQQLGSAEQLIAAGTAPGVTVTYQCGEWFLGTDSSGVTIFASTKDGTILSHGTYHSGFEISTLPSTLPLPITLGQ